ncbi:hypothetical protein H0H92_007753 [Tricholoma furcatifolium]|nr:hypothetical protein H0H92_007753 [Tricholoma furcatifolium]
MSRTEAHITDDLNKSIADTDISRTTELLDEWSSLSSAPPPRSLLAAAAQTGSAPIVSLLLSRGVTVDGDAVVSAFSAPNVDIFQAFSDSGFDINTNLGHIGNILRLSLRTPSILAWALAHGANPNYRTGFRSTLDLAVINASPDAVNALIAHGARVENTNALKCAAYYGRTDMIELLISKGAKVNEIPDYPEMLNSERVDGLGTALHEAAAGDQLAAVQFLLYKGADPAVKNSIGKTALDIARKEGYTKIVNILKERM